MFFSGVKTMKLNRLKELREKNGYSLKYLGDYLGISYQAYSYYETKDREPSAKSLKMLSKLYGVSTDYILENESETENKNYSTEVQEIIDAMMNVDNATQKKILAGAKAFVPEAFVKYPEGYKYPIGFIDAAAARRYYEANSSFAPSFSGEEATDDEIIQLANELYEEQKAHKKQ